MIVALAGRRIDAGDAEISSFPLQNIERVRQKLRELFIDLKPAALVSSAACGADLLALEEAAALGIRRRVILPFDSVRFLETSVLDRPGEWRSTYERVVREVSAAGDLIVLENATKSDESYLLANQAILDEAFELANASNDKLTAVLVWDGRPRGPEDLTQAFRMAAQKCNCSLLDVSTVDGATYYAT